jgi:type I restriction enzyme S subunit
MQNISKGQFENILIPLPTLEEQRRLIQILELECGRYDAAIDKANSQIDILKEYKQSLITEVVTGKRKVC